MIAEGPGGVGNLKGVTGGSKQIANLPPKLREKVLQAGKNGFPKGYEKLLEDYYKRLAGAETPPAERPKKDDKKK